MNDAEIPVLFCCPICSVMEPPAITFNHAQLHGAFVHPQLNKGRRSGKYWFIKRTGCQHGPHPDNPYEDPLTIANSWNEWAKEQAKEKSERLKFLPERNKMWLYYLGMAPHPSI